MKKHIFSSIELLNGNCFLEEKGKGYYAYSFDSNIGVMNEDISKTTNLKSYLFFDNFIIVEPLEKSKKSKLWQQFFEYISPVYENIIEKERNIENIYNLYSILKENAGLDKKSKILDFACGTGISKTVIKNVMLTGTDSSRSMLQLANAKGLKTRSLQTLKKKNNYYDAAFSSYALDICHNDEKTLSMLWRALKYDAVFVANFHKNKGLMETIDFVKRNNGEVKKITSSEKHGDYYAFIKKRNEETKDENIEQNKRLMKVNDIKFNIYKNGKKRNN